MHFQSVWLKIKKQTTLFHLFCANIICHICLVAGAWSVILINSKSIFENCIYLSYRKLKNAGNRFLYGYLLFTEMTTTSLYQTSRTNKKTMYKEANYYQQLVVSINELNFLTTAIRSCNIVIWWNTADDKGKQHRKKHGGGGWGVINKVLYGEAPPSLTIRPS